MRMTLLDSASLWRAALQRGWLTGLGLSFLFVGFVLPSVGAAMQDDASDGSGEETVFLGGSYPLEDAAGLLAGDVSFDFADPDGSTISFTAQATDLTDYPGSLYLEETPFGPAALLAGSNPGDSPFYFYVPSVGVLAPLGEVDPLLYVGPLGSGTLTVSMQALKQGPLGTRVGLGKTKDGRKAIMITAPCAATFKQFVTKTITWKGTTPGPGGGGPVSTGGSFNGPVQGTGNAGRNQTTDGHTVYVDASAPGNGDYSNVQNNSNGSTTMSDGPSVPDPSSVANAIQTANPGVTVTEFTVTWRFTVYVYCGGAIREKVKWSCTRTYKAPFAGPQAPGGFGGPGLGPTPPGGLWSGSIPTVESADALETEHSNALTNFQSNTTYSGAQTQGW